MGVGLAMVQVNVTDLAEARRFHGTALGLPLRDPFGNVFEVLEARPEGPAEVS